MTFLFLLRFGHVMSISLVANLYGVLLSRFVFAVILSEYFSHFDQQLGAGQDELPWGAVDAEIKVPSGEKTDLKRSPFKAWSSRSVYSHTCYAYCQGFLPYLFLPFRSVHLHFFQNLSRFFLVLAVSNTGSCVGCRIK